MSFVRQAARLAMVKFQDYYATLGVERGASRDEIQRAYRKLARKHHPDIDRTPGATQRFAQINEAHEVLIDPEKRKRYDALGSRWKEGEEFRPPPEWEASFGGARGARGSRAPEGAFEEFDFEAPEGFSSFFEAFFGGGGPGGFGARRGPPRPRAGRMVEAQLEIDLEDAYAGATRTITLATDDGAAPARTYDVRIPPGTIDGSTIRLRGQGDPGRSGGPAGDLLLHVRIREHPRFTHEGTELGTTLRVTPSEAALGAKIDVPVLGGQRVVLAVPAGSSSGKKLRVRGMGLPSREGGRGDLIVELSIAVPESLGADERRLYEELARVSTFHPRPD
jgi:curved DNA-binding protein